MFDRLYAGLDEPALVAAIEQAAREEARAGARKMAAIAELVNLTVDEDDERGMWAFDPWKNAACQVGAALSISPQRASAQMCVATALRYRLPKVAALYLQGRLSARLISEITWRTHLVTDDIIAVVDAALAAKAQTWGPLSDEKLVNKINAVIERHDPDAVRRAKEVLKKRDVQIGAHEDPDAVTSLWGLLLAPDAAVYKARIARLVNGLCEADPRSIGERRSDAMGAIGRGEDHLRCRCGSSACTASGPAKSPVVIHVIADKAAVDAAKQVIAAEDREQQNIRVESERPQPESEPDESEPESRPGAEPVEPGLDCCAKDSCAKDSGVALLAGAQVLPVVALAEAIRSGALIKPLWLPGPDPEPHYQPSAKLAAFIRARDVFCRFPGCGVPAERCDIDHVVPYPYGPTHASNMHCKCRTHHLMKTFWGGPHGWRDEQLPDGTVIWTTPAGQTYTTTPGSRLFFPTWNTTTAHLPPMSPPPPGPGREVQMPKRQRTRAADRAARIKAEREHNAAQRLIEQQPQQPHPPPDYGNDPPPF
ncbi:HNH endonuclease [Mycobacterium sp. SMC-8]|uniref:HNH endonuclease signature motif containing protein n=1 Tax=Mycobacterium sp. SMC-8 TaxID=2857060 RepID=UPI0021B17E75|nr:HNH endonuclease signature motif containing protein [Mycobacterium sp. SMC-8]UXA13430.1 HNH endonuclease [Mycobacterium sp. SMC-8]